MSYSKINPMLWFHVSEGKLQTVIDYYAGVFGDNFSSGPIISLGNTPGGYAEMGSFTLFGQSYQLMTSSELHHSFNDSFSNVLMCADQAELDHFWNYFTLEGKESMCGWCQDKFGLRWQVIPQNMGELLAQPNGHAVMMQQRKIVIADYFNQ